MMKSIYDTSGKSLLVHYFRDLSNAGTKDLRVVRLDGEVRYIHQEYCLCCEEKLRTLVTFFDGNRTERIRIGCCGACGYLGYMDRPDDRWMKHFYTEEWDAAKESFVAIPRPTHGASLSQEQKDALRLAVEAGAPRGAPLCDIGCGTGSVLEAFARDGFTHRYGVEHSRWRAQAAAERSGSTVYTGGFADSSVQESLRPQAPFGVLFSFHVLEHVTYPAAFIRCASELQDEKGALVLATPEAVREPAVSTVFWLPHLSSFSRVALERLLNRYGYQIEADNFSHGGLMVRARKVRNPVARYKREAGYAARAAETLARGIFMDALAPGKRYKIWWTSKSFETGIAPVPASGLFDLTVRAADRIFQFAAARVLGKFDNRRSFVASVPRRRLTSPEESPIEIQFDGAIKLLVR